jgi:hypothetical protein
MFRRPPTEVRMQNFLSIIPKSSFSVDRQSIYDILPTCSLFFNRSLETWKQLTINHKVMLLARRLAWRSTSHQYRPKGCSYRLAPGPWHSVIDGFGPPRKAEHRTALLLLYGSEAEPNRVTPFLRYQCVMHETSSCTSRCHDDVPQLRTDHLPC